MFSRKMMGDMYMGSSDLTKYRTKVETTELLVETTLYQTMW